MIYGTSIPATLGRQQKAGILSNSDGFCVTELMISLAIGVAVLATALTGLNIVQAHASKQHRILNHQQDVRLGLEVFEQEVRLAIPDTIAVVSPEEFRFYANLGNHRTTTTVEVLPGSSVLPVQDGSGWGEGKTISVCGQNVCESHRLARQGQRSQLTLAEPVGTAFPNGASVQVNNRVRYYVKRSDDGSSILMRMVDGGASVLIGQLNDLRFSYWSDMGQVYRSRFLGHG